MLLRNEEILQYHYILSSDDISSSDTRASSGPIRYSFCRDVIHGVHRQYRQYRQYRQDRQYQQDNQERQDQQDQQDRQYPCPGVRDGPIPD